MPADPRQLLASLEAALLDRSERDSLEASRRKLAAHLNELRAAGRAVDDGLLTLLASTDQIEAADEARRKRAREHLAALRRMVEGA